MKELVEKVTEIGVRGLKLNPGFKKKSKKNQILKSNFQGPHAKNFHNSGHVFSFKCNKFTLCKKSLRKNKKVFSFEEQKIDMTRSFMMIKNTLDQKFTNDKICGQKPL